MLEKLAVPFTPELRRQHGVDVACLPHSISPLPLPEIVKSLTPSQCKLADSITFAPQSVEFSMVRCSGLSCTLLGVPILILRTQMAVYPVLLPVYLMKYNLKVPSSSETVALTCLLQAHAEDVRGIPFPRPRTHTNDIRRVWHTSRTGLGKSVA